MLEKMDWNFGLVINYYLNCKYYYIIMLLYNSMLLINEKYYLPCWILYMDLIDTKYNPEDYNFYNWNAINENLDDCNLNLYKRNFHDNIDTIIEIVKKNVINITNNTPGYCVENEEAILDLGLINCPKCHHFIDTYGYCYC